MTPFAWSAALVILGSDLTTPIPQKLECPAPLVWRGQQMVLDLHPDSGAGIDAEHCRRSDGALQGPAVAWGFNRKKLAMVGSYCDGHASGRWTFFGLNGGVVRDGSFIGASLKHGAWADYDGSGRKVSETVYANGAVLARQEYARSRVELLPDPEAQQRIAVERFQAALRQPCPAVAKPLRPFRGLREELRAADGVLVLRVEGFAFVDSPPGFGLGEMPSPPQEIDATVKKVLAGFLARPGARIRLRLDAAEHQRWIQKHWGPPEFASGVRPGEDVTALVKRNGDRLEILNLLKVAEDERTDALFTEYARLAALDDDAFAAGLARLIADVVRGSPDRLLWVRWTVLALDDWARLPAPPVSGDRRFRSTVTRTLDAVVAQLRSFPPPPDEFGPNLHDLPWLIRLLTEHERRTLARALLRLHPIFNRELATAEAQAAAESHPRGPLDELTATDIFHMVAGAGMSALMECLSLCLDPRDGRWRPGDDTLERVTAFIGKAPARPGFTAR